MPQAPDIRIVVEKTARRLRVYSGEAVLLDSRIAIGRNSGADKTVEGDEATPLGEFFVCARNPRSRFFLSLCISYPNAAHADRGLRDGLIDAEQHVQIIDALAQRRTPPQHTRLGGEIYIHGEAPIGETRGDDATRGCIALDNPAMRALFDLTPLGTRISIEA
jgi:murein L,D-transpeptidase YafK